ncbi:MAG: alpha/beta hydrolase [Betaproteobacteria bacterium]|nr:alpha/beta hydrolase [Betaproteobacteria bacterium]
MNLQVDARAVFAYTANHELDASKRTVLFIHGAGLDHSWFGLQSRYFGYHGWNVLALDLPGHGRSAGPALQTVPAMADWLLRALDAAKVASAALVGHSMGTLIALDCAARHAARVERIALIATAYPMKVGEAFLEAARRNEYSAFDMHTIWGHAPQVPLGANPNPGMWMYGDTQARLERLAPGVLHADLKASSDYRFPGGVKCPTLFILGRRDMMTPPRAAKALQEQIPGARSVVIDYSGHSLMAEAPDAVLDALIDFLR